MKLIRSLRHVLVDHGDFVENNELGQGRASLLRVQREAGMLHLEDERLPQLGPRLPPRAEVLSKPVSPCGGAWRFAS